MCQMLTGMGSAEFQKQSLVSAEIDRLLEEAERNEAFSMADISRLEQRLKLLQLQIKRTRNSLLGFREEVCWHTVLPTTSLSCSLDAARVEAR